MTIFVLLMISSMIKFYVYKEGTAKNGCLCTSVTLLKAAPAQIIIS